MPKEYMCTNFSTQTTAIISLIIDIALYLQKNESCGLIFDTVGNKLVGNRIQISASILHLIQVDKNVW